MKLKRPHPRLAAALAVIIAVTGLAMIFGHTGTARLAAQHTSSPHLTATVGNASSTASTTQSAENSLQTAASSSKARASIQPLDQASPANSQQIPASVQQARELDASGTQLLKSVVNIVCLSGDSSVPSVSGSGIIIDSRGIILTAAHVAQLFLLQDFLGPSKVQCLIRTGSPARRAYLAEPIYVSKSWISNNPATLTISNPVGTGENDVALLGITATATSTPLPNSYPSIPLASGDPQVTDKVAIASYGAQYLSGSEINYSLYPILTFGSIKSRYTYGNNTVDLISVTGGAASQEGSSGGGVSNAQGQLIGVITTSSISGNFDTRLLNAITPFHLRQSYLKDTGRNLDTMLQSESVSALIADFASESKILGGQLMSDIAANGK